MATVAQATHILPQFLPLEAGDHLDQATFHTRYAAMPASFRAELIGGIVIVPSPLSRGHGVHHALIMAWLGQYWIATPGTLAWDSVTTILSDEDEVQPDAGLIIEPAYGGQTGVTEDDYTTGPPELIVEIASSSASIDLHAKHRAYEQAGVQEYVVVLVRQRAIRWFVRQQGTYAEMAAPADGVYRSYILPGLWLHAEALLQLDGGQVIAVLQQGLIEPEHTAFVQALQARRITA